MNRFLLLPLIALASGACGHDDGTMMSEYAQDIGRHIDALQTEHAAHSAEIASLSALDTIRGAETSHWQRIEEHLNPMNLVMGEMMACGGNRGARIDAAGLAGSVQRIRSEGDGHRQAMQLAADLEAARSEEARHSGSVHDTMIVMLGQWNMMMLDSVGYSCSHCRYCGM